MQYKNQILLQVILVRKFYTVFRLNNGLNQKYTITYADTLSEAINLVRKRYGDYLPYNTMTQIVFNNKNYISAYHFTLHEILKIDE